MNIETTMPIQFTMNTWELQTSNPDAFNTIQLNLFHTSSERLYYPPISTRHSGRPRSTRFKPRAQKGKAKRGRRSKLGDI